MDGLNVISHNFIGGVYAKECVIDDGFRVAQHVHKHDHMSILAEGCAVVWQDDTQETYFAPAIINIKAGVKHSVEAVNGSVTWLCIHATDETDESKVDDVLIEPVANMIDTGFTVDTRELMALIDANPHLWNQYTMRTQDENSPHYGCEDIWVRYNAPENLDMNNLLSMNDKHESVWYDSEIKNAVMQIEFELSQHLPQDYELGGILITRIPVGQMVKRHADGGRWHAEHYKDKYLISLRADENQAFCYDNEHHVTQVGKVYKFNNLQPHWVENNSDKERISLIICTRHA